MRTLRVCRQIPVRKEPRQHQGLQHSTGGSTVPRQGCPAGVRAACQQAWAALSSCGATDPAPGPPGSSGCILLTGGLPEGHGGSSCGRRCRWGRDQLPAPSQGRHSLPASSVVLCAGIAF